MDRKLMCVVMVLATGCGGGNAEGVLTDAISGEGIAEMRMIARATSPDASLTCKTFEGTTDASGAFTITGLCGGTAYELSTADDQLWMPDAEPVPDGGAAGLALQAWVASEGSGVYKLSGRTLSGVRSASDLKRETLIDSEEQVAYPSRIPGKVELIAEGEHLVLLGKNTIANQEIAPLIRTGERKFAGEITMQPWSFIGVKFTDDTAVEKVTASVDAGKMTEKSGEDRAARYIAHDALPAGRYAGYDPKKDRGVVTIVDFGVATPKRGAE